MSTERFDPDRLIFTIRHSTAVHRDDIVEVIGSLTPIAADEAEHMVAVAGEDERAYGPRREGDLLAAMFGLMDEHLADDEGGYREMSVHVTRHARWPQAVEFWFQVKTTGAQSSVWLRHLVMRIDESTLFASIGRSSGGVRS